MKTVFLFVTTLILLFSHAAFSQTVEKVVGKEATIVLQGAESVRVRDTVHFLSNDLEVVGHGEVMKISEGGRKALVRIDSGYITPGMSVERSRNGAEGPAPAPAPTKQQPESGRSDSGLTQEEKEILRRGPIDTPQYVIGGIAGSYLGFGIGHAIQGRYADRGWIFTVGELGSMAVFVVSASHCVVDSVFNHSCNDGFVSGSLLAFAGFKIWEIVDLWVTPIGINRRYRELDRAHDEVAWKGMIVPTKDGVALAVGMTF